tara:strand:- start:324396 stop:324602 length:207 start_codon:yes stop_codon:yes gene_type:complete
MRTSFFTASLLTALFATIGCSDASPDPQTTELSEIDQYLADNPDHAAKQLAADEAAEAEEDADGVANE